MVSFSNFMPCSCYGPSNKLCTTGCGCPCHSTPEFAQKLEMMKQQYDKLLMSATEMSEKLDGDEFETLQWLLKNTSKLVEVIQWYERLNKL
jgi:hypothetical protein